MVPSIPTNGVATPGRILTRSPTLKSLITIVLLLFLKLANGRHGNREIGCSREEGRRCDENYAPAAGNYLVSTTTTAAVAAAKVSLDHRPDKSRSCRSACLAIRDDRDGFYGAVLRKCVIEIVFCRLKRQISNKYCFRHLFTYTCEGTSGALRRGSKNNRRPVRRGTSEHLNCLTISLP